MMRVDKGQAKGHAPPGLLKQNLSLLDAVALNIGAIIGAGIFVVTGIVAGQAGAALVISIVMAAVVSFLTALSFIELSARFTREGGAYRFAAELVSPLLGFLAGWGWLAANTLVGAAVALSFGHYLTALVPAMPYKLSAALLTAAFTLLNVAGAQSSARVNNLLVATKLVVLAFFVVLGALHVQTANLAPFQPLSGGVLYGAYLIFFAFSGFGRVTVVAAEVKDPHRNVPRAIFLSLLISTAIYIGVGFVAVGLVGPARLGGSSSPLVDAIRAVGSQPASIFVGVGGLLATATVLLTNILGVSRMGYVMAHDGYLPALLGRLGARHSPYLSILIFGGLMLLLALALNLTSAVAISTLASLFYYAAGNLAALRLQPEDRAYPPLIPLLGFISCVGLAVFALVKQPITWAVGGAVLLAGLIYYQVTRHRAGR